ncbi:MAG: alpha-hydroxy acid oxidase [Actinomycetota bacterium]
MILETLRSAVRLRRFRFGRTARQLDRAANVMDLRSMSRRRLPGGVFDYIDGAAEDERSLARSMSAFADLEFVPRVLRDVSDVDTTTSLLGKPLDFPFIAAPTGFTRIAHSEGELAVARSAQQFGIPYTLSTLGTRSIEEVAAVNHGRTWFQVYVWKDRGLVEEMVRRAAEAGFEAIVPTVDLATFGRRERDVRRGFELPPKIGLDTIVDGIRHPNWTWDFLRGGPIRFANVAESDGSGARDGTDAINLAAYANEQLDPSLSWADIEWFRSIWDGPIIVKGIQCVDDAIIAADLGIEAIAISNHGGRQLEGSPPPIELIAPVRDAVQDRCEIICDGGIRRGSDIVKALALGADATMGGRVHFYGLGAAGPAGVDAAFGFLRDEMRRSMALNGLRSIAEIDDRVVGRPRDPHPHVAGGVVPATD